MKFWPEKRFASQWLNKKVRLTREHPPMPKGSLGIVVEWRNGWPVVLFSEQINGDDVNIIELTKDRDAAWLPVRLDNLEKVG